MLQVINKTNNKPFTKDDEDSIVSISMQLSATLEKTLLFEQSQADMKASKSQLHTAKSQLQMLHQRLEEEEKQTKMSRRKSVKEKQLFKITKDVTSSFQFEALFDTKVVVVVPEEPFPNLSGVSSYHISTV